METDEIFLRKTTDLFLQNGAKSVTMDDVAREFGMSKKTLYQKYRNKELLLEAILQFTLDEVISRLKFLNSNIENAIERMMCRDAEIDKVSHSNNSLLIRQLIKYYPAIFNRHMVQFSKKFSEVMVHNIEKGRSQGYYRTDFDAELYAKIYFQLIMSYDSSPFLDTEITDRAQYHFETMMMYLHAITTEKGKEVLKTLTKI